jgi:AraC-like DNA-binding protein
MKKIITFICVITNYVLLQANPSSDSIINNLSKCDYESLIKKVRENEKNITFKKAWLLKAKKEVNFVEQINAYRQLMINEPINIKKNYSDSIITVALKTKDKKIIGNAFLNKGIVFYENKELAEALNYYLKAEDYLEKSNDKYASNKTKYAIAQTKYYLGFYDEAIKIFNEVALYFIEENDRAYLNTIHALGLCYQKINNFDKSKYYISLGQNLSQKWDIQEMIKYFDHTQAINFYHQKKYNLCIEGLKNVIPKLNKENNFDNKTVANFYIAKSYWKQNKHKEALPYLLKVDKTFLERKYIRPDLRENYELLIKYFTKKEDTKMQLLYINRLLKVDSILNNNYKYLSQKIFKEYDAKKLIKAKTELEDSMKWKNKVAYATSFFILISTVVIIRKHRKKSKYYKLKFDELMSTNNTESKIISKPLDVDLEINPEIVEMVLKNLEKFEKSKKYLEKEMTLSRIATYLKTNTKYASKIILKHRGKKTIDYINDLKIDQIIELLKTENKYRNYTNKALADEVGFGSTQNFTRAFKNKTDISPTYFIQKLNEIQ